MKPTHSKGDPILIKASNTIGVVTRTDQIHEIWYYYVEGVGEKEDYYTEDELESVLN